MPKLTAIVGQIIHCVKPYELEVIDGFVIFDDNGKVYIIRGFLDDIIGNHLQIQSVGKGAFPAQETEPSVRTLSKTQLLIPGLIDTHIHAPQYPNVGLGYDKPLLDWLKDYTYELEKKYKDLEFSRKVYEAVVVNMLEGWVMTDLTGLLTVWAVYDTTCLNVSYFLTTMQSSSA